MKNLKDIIESQNFLVNRKLKNRQQEYKYHPKTKDELYDIIIDILINGETDLNCIDVSEITDMRSLFYAVNKEVKVKYIDISEWDVSNVKEMEYMFFECKEFNSDLSKWDVSNVMGIQYMFHNCCKFDADLSDWNVSRVTNMRYTFYNCETLKKNNLIPKWYNKDLGL